MAIIDYGAIAFKNGKLISTGMFTPMEETCGFTDKGSLLLNKSESFAGNNFVVIGNHNIIFGFYKECVSWWCGSHHDDPEIEDFCALSGGEWFGWSHYEKWKRWTDWFIDDIGEYHATISVKPIHPHFKHTYYKAKIKMDNRKTKEIDTYIVYFGWGVDFNFYKKTKRINYYSSPEYNIKKFFRNIGRWISRRW